MYFCISADKHLSHSVSTVNSLMKNQGQVMEERQDGEVEGPELTSCHKNIKITTNCQIITDKKDSTIPKKDTLHPKQEATRDDSRGAFSI